jgi:hypothetical protein
MHKQARIPQEPPAIPEVLSLIKTMGQKPRSRFAVECSSAVLTAITWIELRRSLSQHSIAAFASMRPWDRILNPQPLTYNEAVESALFSVPVADEPGEDPPPAEIAAHKTYLDGIFAAAWAASRFS